MRHVRLQPRTRFEQSIAGPIPQQDLERWIDFVANNGATRHAAEVAYRHLGAGSKDLAALLYVMHCATQRAESKRQQLVRDGIVYSSRGLAPSPSPPPATAADTTDQADAA